MAKMVLDVSNINSVENILLSEMTNGFSILTVYAKHLLYYFIAFEIIFSGLGWALYQNRFAERLFSQLIKIGLILFFIENYTFLLDSLLSSVTLIGQQLTQEKIEKILLNPGFIWQYGYNFSVSLLQTAASSDGFALPMIFMVLGFGILFVVGLFGIQIFIQVVAFYFVAAISLLMMPLAVLHPMRDFFSQSIRSVMQAAVRLMVQMFIVSAAISVWSALRLHSFSPQMNINAPLGFFFSGLLFVFASFYLPRLAEKAVGSIQWQSAPVVVAPPPLSVNVSAGAVSTTSHAASITAHAMQLGLSGTSAAANQAAMLSPPSAAQASYIYSVKDDFLSKSVGHADKIAKVSGADLKTKEEAHREDIKKIKTAFYELIQEMKNQDKQE